MLLFRVAWCLAALRQGSRTQSTDAETAAFELHVSAPPHRESFCRCCLSRGGNFGWRDKSRTNDRPQIPGWFIHRRVHHYGTLARGCYTGGIDVYFICSFFACRRSCRKMTSWAQIWKSWARLLCSACVSSCTASGELISLSSASAAGVRRSSTCAIELDCITMIGMSPSFDECFHRDHALIIVVCCLPVITET